MLPSDAFCLDFAFAVEDVATFGLVVDEAISLSVGWRGRNAVAIARAFVFRIVQERLRAEMCGGSMTWEVF